MELLFFISGVLFVLYAHSSYEARRYKKEYTTLLESLRTSQNISSIRYGEAIDKIDEMNLYISDVKEKLEKDSYSDINKVNTDIKVIEKAMRGESKRATVLEGNVKDIYNKIQNTQNMIRALKEDPNFNNRY